MQLSFNFLNCPLCKNQIAHSGVALEVSRTAQPFDLWPPISMMFAQDVLKPQLELLELVKYKATLRLEYEVRCALKFLLPLLRLQSSSCILQGLAKCREITDPNSQYFNDPVGYAMHKFAYYQCFKCRVGLGACDQSYMMLSAFEFNGEASTTSQKPYYGGDNQCAAALGAVQFDPSELICGGCSPVSCQGTVCLLVVSLSFVPSNLSGPSPAYFLCLCPWLSRPPVPSPGPPCLALPDSFRCPWPLLTLINKRKERKKEK